MTADRLAEQVLAAALDRIGGMLGLLATERRDA